MKFLGKDDQFYVFKIQMFLCLVKNFSSIKMNKIIILLTSYLNDKQKYFRKQPQNILLRHSQCCFSHWLMVLSGILVIVVIFASIKRQIYTEISGTKSFYKKFFYLIVDGTLSWFTKLKYVCKKRNTICMLTVFTSVDCTMTLSL